MNEKPAETIGRIKSILDSLAQKREEFDKVTSDMNRLAIMKDRTEVALLSLRVQLVAELRKFDPGLEILVDEEVGVDG